MDRSGTNNNSQKHDAPINHPDHLHHIIHLHQTIMKIFASYGSLRKGFWNHTRFGLEEPIATAIIRGSMFMNKSLGYPWLFNEQDSKAANSKTKDYNVELFEVDEEKFNRIDMMEQMSGYKAEKVIFMVDEHKLDKKYIGKGGAIEATVWFADPLAIKPNPDQFIEEYKLPQS